MSKKAKLPDCLSCGACCVAPGGQGAFADVSSSDVKRLGVPWSRKNILFSTPFDRMLSAFDGCPVPFGAIRSQWTKQRNGPLEGFELCSCVALTGGVMGKVKCAVYKKRPETCRTSVVPGDETCLDLRKIFREAVETHGKSSEKRGALAVAAESLVKVE